MTDTLVLDASAVLGAGPFRLVTRSDFDGLVCAVLLRQAGLIDDILFVHPKDVQDGTVDVTGRDLLTNLPFDPRAHLVFDHHLSETVRNQASPRHVIDPAAPSAARVVHSWLTAAGHEPAVSDELMRAVDQADSAQYALADVLEPSGWTLLNFLMDSRTGLGRFRDFRVSNYQLMMQLIDHCVRYQDVTEILALPDVAERVELYRAQEELFRAQLLRVTTLHGDVAVVDLREEDVVHAGNRFLVYALFPQARVSVHVMWGRNRQNTVLAVGRSILDRSSTVDVGAVCLAHGGGGHAAAGTCQVPHEAAERTLADVVGALRGR
ncbi:exopolyphosphatase [Aquipuribacter sp. SD81]|uniref:exopolyphosphatase n=1 Tax=Aquipuribacter sp. SD81 TaxID=3127703 RepID=UPI00301AB34F